MRHTRTLLIVSDVLLYACSAVVAIAACYALFLAVSGRPVDNPMFWLLLAVELVMVLVLVSGFVTWASVSGYPKTSTLFGYLITVVILPPLALLWGIAEKSRWGPGVLFVGLLSLGVLLVRLHDIWPVAV